MIAKRRAGEVPDLLARRCVGGPHVVRHREVHDAIHHQRRRLDRGPRLERPCTRQRADVALVDLLERAEPLPRVVAVVLRPVRAETFEQHGGVDALRRALCPKRGSTRECEEQVNYRSAAPRLARAAGAHFSVSRYANTSCMVSFVYVRSNSKCLASGSVTCTLTESDGHVRGAPSALIVTSNASCRTRSPVNRVPVAAVTVAF